MQQEIPTAKMHTTDKSGNENSFSSCNISTAQETQSLTNEDSSSESVLGKRKHQMDHDCPKDIVKRQKKDVESSYEDTSDKS